MTVIVPTQPAGLADALRFTEPDRAPGVELQPFEGVEFFKGDVWLSGRVDRGQFRRLSDVLNNAGAGLLLREAVVCGVPGPSGSGASHDTWIDLRDIDLVGHDDPGRGPTPAGEQASDHVAKKRERLRAWTASHEIQGTIHLHPQALLEVFLRSDDPPLIAMTDAEVSWVTPGRTPRRFPFVLLNRRRIFATRPE